MTDNVTGVTPSCAAAAAADGNGTLDPGETWACTATGTAIDVLNPPAGVHLMPNVCSKAGTVPPSTAYTNIGTVTTPFATASDPDSYCNPSGVTIKKFTNGADANNPNGADVPRLQPGDAITWRYDVTNTGATHVPLADVHVTGGPCADWLPLGPFTLAPGASQDFTCTFTVTNAVVNWFANGQATDSLGRAVPSGTGTPEHQQGSVAPESITIVKLTNGVNANDPNGANVPVIGPGGAITWTYNVTNNGQSHIAAADVHVHLDGSDPVLGRLEAAQVPGSDGQ